jgi:predicted enzyme related to lactoylglutathione lyase
LASRPPAGSAANEHVIREARGQRDDTEAKVRSMSMNKVDYFEIGTPNPEVTKHFYSELFGWQIGPSSPADYSMVNETEGGIWDTSAIGAASYAIFYVHVDDVEEIVKKAESLGAQVAVPVTSNNAIEFAHLVDTNGNRFGVWRPKSS